MKPTRPSRVSSTASSTTSRVAPPVAEPHQPAPCPPQPDCPRSPPVPRRPRQGGRLSRPRPDARPDPRTAGSARRTEIRVGHSGRLPGCGTVPRPPTATPAHVGPPTAVGLAAGNQTSYHLRGHILRTPLSGSSSVAEGLSGLHFRDKVTINGEGQGRSRAGMRPRQLSEALPWQSLFVAERLKRRHLLTAIRPPNARRAES